MTPNPKTITMKRSTTSRTMLPKAQLPSQQLQLQKKLKNLPIVKHQMLNKSRKLQTVKELNKKKRAEIEVRIAMEAILTKAVMVDSMVLIAVMVEAAVIESMVVIIIKKVVMEAAMEARDEVISKKMTDMAGHAMAIADSQKSAKIV